MSEFGTYFHTSCILGAQASAPQTEAATVERAKLEQLVRIADSLRQLDPKVHVNVNPTPVKNVINVHVHTLSAHIVRASRGAARRIGTRLVRMGSQ